MVERRILPHGEILRDFLAQTSISRSELRKIARQRGIFLPSDDKAATIPTIMRTGLTPAEFEGLLLSIDKREHNPKFSSQSIIASDNTLDSTISIISDHFDYEPILNTDYESYRFKGTPSFAMIDGNPEAVEIIFFIERSDFSKSISKSLVTFEGKVTIQRNPVSGEYSIMSMHTSRETKDVCDEIAKAAIDCLKSGGAINHNSTPTKVRFSDFSNENRFKFLIGLATNKSTKLLTFQSINDVGFKPSTTLERPEQLHWLEQNIKNARFRGSSLDQIAIMRNPEFQSHIELFRIDADFEYVFDAFNGTCSLSFDFASYHSDDDIDAELIVTVSKLRNFDVNSLKTLNLSGASKISEKIRGVIDAEKILLHKTFRKAARQTQAETVN